MSLSLTRLATARLLGAGPETCKRVEAQVLVAIKKAEWNQATTDSRGGRITMRLVRCPLQAHQQRALPVLDPDRAAFVASSSNQLREPT